MLDVVILSNAKTAELGHILENAVKSLICSRPGLYSVTVIEQNIEYKHSECLRSIYLTESFNYNKFANIGANTGFAEWICIANNDLVFHPGWFDEMMKVKHPVMSPRCPVDVRQRDITQNETGTQVGRHLSGWCFVIRRDIWEKIGGFDEDFPFWCADNSFVEQLKAIGIEPMIVANSIVEHLGSRTLKTMDNRKELTEDCVRKFNKKFNQNLFGWGT